MNKLRAATIALVTSALTLTAFAAADKDSFTLIRGGKQIGKASYTISKSKEGWHVIAHFQYRAPGGKPSNDVDDSTKTSQANSMFNEGQMTEDYKVTDDENFLSGYIQNATNQMLTSFQPDKARKVVTIGQNQGGIAGDSRSVDLANPDFLLAADYDPSVIQLMVTKVMNHPHPDRTYIFLTPITSNPRGGAAQLVPVSMGMIDGTVSGTLDGKPVTLKHFQMKFHTSQADVYTDDAGTLMEADMGSLSTNYVRVGFALNK